MTQELPAPTNSELEILHVLWRRGPATVRDVFEEIGSKRDVGYTTVLKLMQLMTEKGLVTRDETNRSHVYLAAVAERQVKRHLVTDLMERAFEGSAANLVLQALASRRASPEEIEQIKALLDQQTRGDG